MSTAGTITVSLAAEIAQFTSAMDKASKIAEDRMKRINETFGIVKTALTTLGAGITVGLTLDKLKESIEGAIKAASGLQELSERTGSAVESLSGLAAVAKLSGTDTDSLATGLQKLSKTMLDAEDNGKKSQSAFNAIGISIKDLKGLKPDEAFQLIAQKMALYADGAEKTAIAQALFGKAGANLLPVMRDLADAGTLQVVVTKEQAEQANQYEKNVRRLQLAQAALWNTISAQVVPVLNAFTKAMLESATQADGVKGAVDGLAKDNTIKEWAQDGAMAVAYLVDSLKGIGKLALAVGGSFQAVWADVKLAAQNAGPAMLAKNIVTGDFTKQLDARNKVVEDANKRYVDLWNYNGTDFSDKLRAQFAKMNTEKPEGSTGPRPTPNYHPNAAANAKDDPAQALMQGIIKQQGLLIAEAEKQYTEYSAYLKAFYSQQFYTAREYYDQEDALIAQNLASKLKDFDVEMAAARSFRAHAQALGNLKQVQEADNAIKEIATKRTEALTDAQKRQIDNVMAYAKPLRDFELATEAVRHQHELDNATMQFNIDMMGRSTLEVQKQTAARNLDLALQQRIYEMKLKGYSADELATRVATATAENEAQKAIAIAQITSAYDLQRDSIFGAHEALRKYVEDSKNGAAQMENVVGGAFKGMEDALVNFVKTGKLNFSSLVDSIIADVARMVIQQQITGPLAGWVMGGLTSMFNPIAAAGNSFDGGLLNGLIMGGTRARGGSVDAGMSYLVGEKGPEIFTAPASGQIIPNDQIGGGGAPVTFIINNTIGDVASKSDVVAGMRTVQAQISQGLMRSKTYAGAMAS
jgi:lambda family phage tail tape measure protein